MRTDDEDSVAGSGMAALVRALSDRPDLTTADNSLDKSVDQSDDQSLPAATNVNSFGELLIRYDMIRCECVG